MLKYSYDGPVFYFDDCIVTRWKAETIAVSEKKARSNLAYKWKMENGYGSNAMIRLTGKITAVDTIDSGNQLKINI